jgi:hypothetical protein
MDDVHDAERMAHRNQMLFDYELKQPASVYAHRNGDEEFWRRRLFPIEIPSHLIADGKWEPYEYGMGLLGLCAMAHRERKLMENDKKLSPKEKAQMEALKMDLASRELAPENEPIAEVMTTQTALSTWWNQ